MKTLIKLANRTKVAGIGGMILFDGSSARSTDCETHAVIENGPWTFDSATVVSVQQIKRAMAISKKTVWFGDTLNGIKLVSAGNVADFIDLPVFNGKRLNVTPETLRDAIAKTVPAMAVHDIRYYLNGLCFDHDDKAIIGCDGNRLHYVGGVYESELTGQSIVKSDAINLAGVKIIHVDFSDTLVRIGYVGGYLISSLIEGKFPDYHRVIPATTDRPNRYAFNGAQCDAVKTICAVNKANKVKFSTATIEPSGLIKTGEFSLPFLPGITLTKIATKIDANSGEYYGQKNYGINAKYLLDALQSAGSGSMAFDGPNDSVLITTGNFKAVVMCCRV